MNQALNKYYSRSRVSNNNESVDIKHTHIKLCEQGPNNNTDIWDGNALWELSKYMSRLQESPYFCRAFLQTKEPLFLFWAFFCKRDQYFSGDNKSEPPNESRHISHTNSRKKKYY